MAVTAVDKPIAFVMAVFKESDTAVRPALRFWENVAALCSVAVMVLT
jgi:hypothetical protein